MLRFMTKVIESITTTVVYLILILFVIWLFK